MKATNASLVITHPVSLNTALSAARQVGLPETRVVTFGNVPGSATATVDGLIQEGVRMQQHFVEPRLQPGEAKSKIAFLNFSSGTTGKPKVRVYTLRCCACYRRRLLRRWRFRTMDRS